MSSLTVASLRARTDLVGGYLEVFVQPESEPDANLDINFRGIITKVTWQNELPTFHLKNHKRFDFKKRTWAPLAGEKSQSVTFDSVRGKKALVCPQKEGLLIPGYQRYFIVPRGKPIPEKPLLKAVSYKKFRKTVLKSLAETCRKRVCRKR